MTRGRAAAPGQVAAFFTEPPPEHYEPPGTLRPGIAGRAGTPLDHRWTHEIIGTARRKRLHGLYDESQRLYQSGGEASNFLYWRRRYVSLDYNAWQQVYQKVDWIEMIDHEANECWRIAMKKAIKHAYKYNAGIGDRVGIPMELWDVIRANGYYKQRGKVA